MRALLLVVVLLVSVTACDRLLTDRSDLGRLILDCEGPCRFELDLQRADRRDEKKSKTPPVVPAP